jgi:hypothetical protein
MTCRRVKDVPKVEYEAIEPEKIPAIIPSSLKELLTIL